MTRKSSTCFEKDGTPLSVYSTETEAQKSADHQKMERGIELFPYLCNSCGEWHLSPENGRLHQCGCTDRNGKPKKLYNNIREAQSIKKLREKEVGKKLTIYPCPNFLETGKYHLTKERKNKRKKVEAVHDLLDKLHATT